MTDDHTDTVTSTPNDVVRALRNELLAESQSANMDVATAEDEQWTADLVAAAAPSPLIRSAARSVLRDASVLLTTDRNRRLLAAVDRALEPVAERMQPFPLLLRTRRLKADTALDDVAAAISVQPALIEDLERGNCEVGQQQAEVIAKWITALDVEPAVALPALDRTLTWEQRATSELAAGSDADRVEIDAFVEQVRSLLSPRSEGEQ